MHFPFVATLVLSLGSALAEPIPQPDALQAVEAAVAKRADNWCRVVTNVNCRKGPGVSYDEVKVEGRGYISPEKNFGVRCTKEGSNVQGDRTWDYIPGWNCWVSAYYTRSAGSQRYCETGLPECRKD
ncbi:hypothetical protein B0T16DRAFT_124495 [Cercophora newfieldiana]|uniref:Uncharacterized protein n=1 Tax=Cercophora newfieldiana TaxID=92897 RepID=A0AA39YDG7_9PEZI|nr:hypothetical protein B0T16DRAFT_124495 [Cercophora newfieldiana]